MVTVCKQGECYQAVIISQAAICPPNRYHRERERERERARDQGKTRSFIITIPEHTSHYELHFDWVSIQSPGERTPSYSVNVILNFFPPFVLFIYCCFPYFFFFLTWSHRLPPPQQRCRRPVAHPILCGSAVPVSTAGIWMCRFGGVHSRRVSHHSRLKDGECFPLFAAAR